MIQIRRAHVDESRQIAGYQVLMAEESEGMKLDEETVQRGVQAVFDDPSKGFYLVAESEEIMVGCLMITLEWSDWRASTVWWIQSLYVLPSFRRQGVFRQMYVWLKEEIANQDTVAGIRLYVDLGNINAQKAYESMGMNGNHYRLYEDI